MKSGRKKLPLLPIVQNLSGVLKEILLVGAGGFVGSVARYGAGLWISGTGLHTGRYPLATFLVNFLGSLLIGILVRNLDQGNIWWLLGVVGFCGGFTTFSAFSLEMLQMLRSGDFLYATGYALVSAAVCITAVYLGTLINFNRC